MQRALITALTLAGLFIAGSPPLRALRSASSVVPSSAGPAGDDVTIDTRDVRLYGSYFPPKLKAGSSRAPGVLLVHEAGADRRQLDDVAKSLNRKGFGVLALDLRGHGQSQTDEVSWQRIKPEERPKLWQQAVRDVEEGASWLLSRNDIHSTKLALVGFRSGCALAARHAENDENVVGLALIAPKAEDFGFNVLSSLEHLCGLPTVLVDVRNDETERIATEANAISPQHPYVSVVTVKKKGESPLDDSKTASRVSSFLEDIAMEKKGREGSRRGR